MRKDTSPSASTVAVLALALAYGGGLWLHVQHSLQGATELNEPPGSSIGCAIRRSRCR